MKTYQSLTPLLLPLGALATFHLDHATKYWDYTSMSLQDTTSPACQTAYNASIKCPSTLLTLVTQSRFQHDASDLDGICTSGCKDSLKDYVKNVQQACNHTGDVAKESLGDEEEGKWVADYVWVVGEIIEYTWAQACAVDSNGKYCLAENQTSSHSPPTTIKSSATTALSEPPPPSSSTSSPTPKKPHLFLPPPPTCNSTCTIQFYQTTQRYHPASHHQLRHSTLLARPNSTIRAWEEGFEKIRKCPGAAAGGGDVTSGGVGPVRVSGVGIIKPESGSGGWDASSTTTQGQQVGTGTPGGNGMGGGSGNGTATKTATAKAKASATAAVVELQTNGAAVGVGVGVEGVGWLGWVFGVMGVAVVGLG